MSDAFAYEWRLPSLGCMAGSAGRAGIFVFSACVDDLCSWVVVGLDPENKKRIVVHASGRCGLDKMKAALKPDQVRRRSLPHHTQWSAACLTSP